MAWKILVTERAARYKLTKAELATYPSRLCATVDVQYDDTTGVGRWDGTYTTVWYEWHVGDSEGDRNWFHQREYVSISTFLRLQGHNFLLVLWLVIAALFNVIRRAGVPSLTELVAAYPAGFGSTEYAFIALLVAVTVGMVGLIKQLLSLLEISDATRAPNPLLRDREQDRTENRRSLDYSEFDVSRFRQYELGCGYVILALSLVLVNWQLPATAALLYGLILCVRIGLGILGYNDRLLAVQRRMQRDSIVPQLSKRSLQLTAVVGSPIILVATLAVLEFDQLLVFSGPIDLVFAALFAWSGVIVSRLANEKYRLVEYYDFVEDPNRRPNPLGAAVGVGCHLLLNAVILGSLLVVWTPSLVPIDATGSAFTLSVWVATALALVVPVGSWYQYADYVCQTETLLEESTAYDLDVAGIDLEYPVRRYDTDDLFATAVTTGDRAAIVVSRGAIEQLDDEEVAAVAAHEEGHLAFDDVALIRQLTLVASATMIGKNVLFDLVDFYDREFRADEHATRRVDSEWLISALESWEAAVAESVERDVAKSMTEGASAAQPNGLASIGPAALRSPGRKAREGNAETEPETEIATIDSNASTFGWLIMSRLESTLDDRSSRTARQLEPASVALAAAQSQTLARLESVFEGTFGLFYTGFTLTRAHPSVSERVAEITAHAGSEESAVAAASLVSEVAAPSDSGSTSGAESAEAAEVDDSLEADDGADPSDSDSDADSRPKRRR